MILNGKEILTGCGLHGYSLVSIPLTGQSNIYCCSFVCCFWLVRCGGEVDDNVTLSVSRSVEDLDI